MIKIGEFSKLSRVSVRMLRYYDEIGLFHPARTDPETGYRCYEPGQLPVIARISALRDMGFGLAQTLELTAGGDTRAMERALLGRRAELCEQLREAQRQLRLVETALKRKENPLMTYDVTLKTFPERHAATLRMTLPHYESEGELWSLLVRETAPLHIVPDDPCYCCVVYHDEEYREADVDVEAQKTVKGRYPDTEHVRFRTLPPVTVASTTFRGSYSQMNEANAAVAQWVTDNGYALDGPAFFIYHVSPHETDDPGQFVTEICYPVRQ